MPPLISVMMPCYNAAKTLPLALASLVAQTYEHWECILVDDGSTDNSAGVLAAINDPRIRYVRFEENRGRGEARQRALELAHGDYLCMLDADDWIYPNKLQRQLEVMEAKPQLAVLSTGMAIVDAMNELVGVRTSTDNASISCFSPLSSPEFPRFAHAPSMIRTDVAKRTKYDLSFCLVEDVDFLIRILLEHPYGILSEITYAYAEIESANIRKITGSMRYGRRMFRKYKRHHPRAVLVNTAKLYAKELIYRVSFAFGFGKRLVAGRSSKPTSAMVEQFEVARRLVHQRGHELFGDTLLSSPIKHRNKPVKPRTI